VDWQASAAYSILADEGYYHSLRAPFEIAGQMCGTVTFARCRGARVWISWASANLAPELFGEPEQVKLDRSPNRHWAFGLGIHRCLGSNLARVVWRIVVEQVLSRMPDYELDLTAERYPSIGITNGWKYTPVTFTPGAKVHAEL
jgi:cytochrome P450